MQLFSNKVDSLFSVQGRKGGVEVNAKEFKTQTIHWRYVLKFLVENFINTNVLSEKVPKFSMALGQEKRVLKWKEPDEICKELAYPWYVKKNAQEEPTNMYQEWEWELKFVVCE